MITSFVALVWGKQKNLPCARNNMGAPNGSMQLFFWRLCANIHIMYTNVYRSTFRQVSDHEKCIDHPSEEPVVLQYTVLEAGGGGAARKGLPTKQTTTSTLCAVRCRGGGRFLNSSAAAA